VFAILIFLVNSLFWRVLTGKNNRATFAEVDIFGFLFYRVDMEMLP